MQITPLKWGTKEEMFVLAQHEKGAVQVRVVDPEVPCTECLVSRWRLCLRCFRAFGGLCSEKTANKLSLRRPKRKDDGKKDAQVQYSTEVPCTEWPVLHTEEKLKKEKTASKHH